MNNLCIIPARGGSKRIPKKNIKEFLGKPIIAHVIETALASNLFKEVMVSTDDEAIKNVALNFGAKVPFIRTPENSNDFATLSDVLIEVIEKYRNNGQEYDNVCCILPTAVIIDEEMLKQAYQKLDAATATVLPVLKYPYPIQRALKDDNGFLFMNDENHIHTRTQDLEVFFHDAGQFYWLKTSIFIKEKNIFANATRYIELKEYQVQDIDTIDDWEMLNFKFNFKNKK